MTFPSDEMILQYFAGKLDGEAAEYVRRYFTTSPELHGVHAGLRLLLQTDVLGQTPDGSVALADLLRRISTDRASESDEVDARQLARTSEWVLLRHSEGGPGPGAPSASASTTPSTSLSASLSASSSASSSALMRIFARSSQNRSGLFSATTLVVLAAVIGFVEWKRYATEHRADANTVVMRELKTQRGQLMTMQFSDGTSVTLAPQTRLRISPAFGEGNRDVVLDGEAYFDVTSRPDAPFVIHTNQSVVHVLGTRFDVRAYGPSTTVGVVSGKVALTTNQAMSAGVIVTKDHVGTIDANGEAQVRWEDMAPYTGWVQGKLVFQATPLPQVLERLGRWYGVRLSTDSEKLIRKSVYAEWQDKSLEDVLQLLSEALNARVVREGDQVTLFAR